MDVYMKLTKKEIGDAIMFWIGIFKENRSFFPYYIKNTDEPLNIPDIVEFELGFIPLGSSTKELPHNI